MRQFAICSVETCSYGIGTCHIRDYRTLIRGPAVYTLFEFELKALSYYNPALLVRTCKQNLQSKVVWIHIANVKHNLRLVLFTQEQGCANGIHIAAYNLYGVPVSAETSLPGCNLPCLRIVIGNKFCLALCKRVVILTQIVLHHSVGCKVAGNLGNTVLYNINPIQRDSLLVCIIVKRSNLALNNIIDGCRIQFI